MKKLLLLILLLPAVLVISCKKEKDTVVPPEEQTPLVFTSLTASDTIIKPNLLTTITATATGAEITYTWDCEWASVIGSGSSVQWTVCHGGRFRITCTVADKYKNSVSKTIYITSNV